MPKYSIEVTFWGSSGVGATHFIDLFSLNTLFEYIVVPSGLTWGWSIITALPFLSNSISEKSGSKVREPFLSILKVLWSYGLAVFLATSGV